MLCGWLGNGADDRGVDDVREAIIAAIRKAKTRKFQVFPTSGTWTKPDAVLSGATVWVTQCGGGGGGGGNDGSGNGAPGGGGGGELHQGVSVTITGNVAVTIGASGAGGGSDGSNGANGGDTTFGALLTSHGGRSNVGQSGGAGYHNGAHGIGLVAAGSGGASYGLGGNPGASAAANTGGGGGGAPGFGSGGAGGSGYCRVDWEE